MNQLTARTRRRAAGLVRGNRAQGGYGESRLNGVRIQDVGGDAAKLRLLMFTVGCRRGIQESSIRRGRYAFEFPLRIAFSTLGLMVFVGANDLIARYLGLEWSSLCLYVLAAIRRGSAYSTEAGLKYLVMGAVASGFLLLGSSLVYGSTGTVQFGDRARRISSSLLDSPLRREQGTGENLLLRSVGLVRVLTALRFKLAVAPFHAWSPDVYEGSPRPSTIFFAVVPKLAMGRALIRLSFGPFAERFPRIQSLRRMGSSASRTVAALAARSQRRLKRFRAYSAIGHMGYFLLGVSAGSLEGVQGGRLYRLIYCRMSLNVWLAIQSVTVRRGFLEKEEENLQASGLVPAKFRTDRSGLSTRNPFLAATLALSVRSMAGIPPRAGFMAKMWVFLAAVSQSLVAFAVFSVLASCVGAFYYLRWVKRLYMDQPTRIQNQGTPVSLVDSQFSSVDWSVSRTRGRTLGLRRLLLRVPSPVRLRTHRMALSLCR